MEHSSLARTRWKPPGRLSTQSLRGTTRLAPTGVEVGGRKRLTRLSLLTAVGTTPYPRSHPDDVPAWGRVRVRLDRGRARSDAGSPAVGCPRRCSAIGRANTYGYRHNVNSSWQKPKNPGNRKCGGSPGEP